MKQTNHYNQFTKAIEDIAYRNGSISNAFDDFLTCALSALSLGRAESVYKETIERYHEQDRSKFGVAFAELVLAYEERITPAGGWCDILGNFFEEHNGKFGRDARGQFFTPESVCDFMAKITATDAEADNDETRTVMDCACGSGRTLIAANRLSPRNRIRHFYTAADIDGRCVKMCTLNFFMHGMTGVVIHMDSLRMEVWGGYRVHMPETGLGIRPLTKAECYSYLFDSANDNEPPKPKPEIVQSIQSNAPVSVNAKGQVQLF